MNHTLLQQQFERLGRTPNDARLLKQLAVELGAALIRSRPEALRAYRVAAASALRACEEAKAETACTALATLLDVAASAEEALTAAREREGVRALASRPLHRAALRALNGRALTTTALAEQLDRHKSQMSDTLKELETAGLVTAVEGLGGDGRGKPYRLTLAGSLLLDELPDDEPVQVDVAPGAGDEQEEWFEQIGGFGTFSGTDLRATVSVLRGRWESLTATQVHFWTPAAFYYPLLRLPFAGTRRAERPQRSWDDQSNGPAPKNRLTNLV